MEITLSVILLIVLLLVFLLVRIRHKTTVAIDGYTIKLRRDRDFAWIVYREPSGRSLTLEAHDWLGPGNKPELLVDFPSEIAFYEEELPPVRGGTMKLDIPGAPSPLLSKEEASLVQERISEGLTRLKIQHEFARPRQSGWTSFEDGKEIYHG
jgi:hypothetical protein